MLHMAKRRSSGRRKVERVLTYCGGYFDRQYISDFIKEVRFKGGSVQEVPDGLRVEYPVFGRKKGVPLYLLEESGNAIVECNLSVYRNRRFKDYRNSVVSLGQHILDGSPPLVVDSKKPERLNYVTLRPVFVQGQQN